MDPTEISLEELVKMKIPTVYGASKHEQKITTAPSSVTIVTKDEIQRYGHRTLGEVLQSVRGLHVTSDRNYAFLGVRGFNRPGDYNSRVLILVDGHRVNENIYDGGYIGNEFILDVDLIDRVEVIRGPGSTLYGNNAFFGVINVVTRRGKDLNTVEGSGEIGDDRTYKGRWTGGKAFENGVELLLSGTIHDSQGEDPIYFQEYDNPAENFGLARRGDYDRSRSLFGSLRWRDFTLQGAFNNREKGIPTGAYGAVFDDPENRSIDERSYAALSYQHAFDNVADVSANIYYDRYDFTGESIFDYGLPALTLNRNLTAGQWWGTEVSARRDFFDRVALTLGAEYRSDFHQEWRLYDVEPRAELINVNRDTENYGIYAQTEWTIVTNLLLNAGARYDQYGHFDATVNPRVGLIYNPWESSVFKLLYGSAFRAPNFYELYYPGGQVNSSLEPEQIRSYEAVVEQNLGAHLRGSVSAFYNEIEDLISVNPATGLFENLDEAESRGLEFELEGKWKELIGRTSYSWQRTENSLTGRVLENSPQHIAKFNLSAPLGWEKLLAGFEFQYISARATYGRKEADSYWVGNFTLYGRELLKGLDVSASVYNLFDNKYGDPAALGIFRQDILPREGRSFRVKLAYRF